MIIQLRLLMVEDSEEDSLLLLRALRKGGYDLVFERVETAAAMQEALNKQRWDIIISDYVMPQFSGLEALRLAKEREPDLPFILVSGQIGEEMAVDALRAGARDFVVKGNLSRLVPAIHRELQEAEVRRDRKRMEAELLRAQKLEMAGTIAGYVAHDFNNLLTPIWGYAEILKSRFPPEDEATKLCETIIAMAKQMSEINAELLTLARRGRIESAPLDLNEVVKKAVDQTSTAMVGITVHEELVPGSLIISGSEAQLLRAVSNLVANAVDAMSGGGLLRLVTRHASDGHQLGLHNHVPPSQYAILDVIDTGCGIPEDIIEKVFEPFYSTRKTDKRRGSGLGLSVAQAIVSDHGGYIKLLSEPGKGTTARLFLPLCDTPPCG
ncbi:MAG: response regulator [Chloroflexi bacterium]|nr:response regulator [Chloroflexota bacterium]